MKKVVFFSILALLFVPAMGWCCDGDCGDCGDGDGCPLPDPNDQNDEVAMCGGDCGDCDDDDGCPLPDPNDQDDECGGDCGDCDDGDCGDGCGGGCGGH